MTDSPHVSVERFIAYLLRGVPLMPEEPSTSSIAMNERRLWSVANVAVEGLDSPEQNRR
jgi:predicted cobalt transporter CbtA